MFQPRRSPDAGEWIPVVGIVLLSLLGVAVLAVIVYGGFIIHNAQMGWCKPFTHRWHVTKVSVPLFDSWSRGELYRCENCTKTMAK